MGICDRIIPNATLSAVMHKEDEISHKTRKQYTRLKIRLITLVTSWTKRCQKVTYGLCIGTRPTGRILQPTCWDFDPSSIRFSITH